MLDLRDLHIGYDEDASRHIVAEALNASLSSGTMTCLVGANGVGKSTLMRTLSGFQPALQGELHVDGRPIGEYTSRELSEKIGVVLTERNATPDLTVEEVVAIGRMPYTNFWGRLTAADLRVVDEAIALVGIEPLRHKKIGRVSDGERQKVMIAKSLAQQTRIILLDEPTAFLDYGSKVAVMRLLRQLAHEQGKRWCSLRTTLRLPSRRPMSYGSCSLMDCSRVRSTSWSSRVPCHNFLPPTDCATRQSRGG